MHHHEQRQSFLLQKYGPSIGISRFDRRSVAQMSARYSVGPGAMEVALHNGTTWEVLFNREPMDSDLWNLHHFADEVNAAHEGKLSPVLGVQMYFVKTHYCMRGRSRCQKRIVIPINKEALFCLNNRCIHNGDQIVFQGETNFRGMRWASLTNVLGNTYPHPMCVRWVKGVDDS